MAWWVLTFLENYRAQTSLFTQAQTNRADHLFMSWSHYKPSRTRVYRTIRGTLKFCGYKYIWNTPNVVEQNESGDTLAHTFGPTPLTPPDHVWYYLWSIAGPYDQPCQGPLVHVLPWETTVPSARLYHSVNQTIPPSTTTSILFDSALWDDGGFHDPASPTRLTAPIPGLYTLGTSVHIGLVGPTNAHIYVRLNATSVWTAHRHDTPVVGPTSTFLTLTTILALDAGDYIEIRLWHASGVPTPLYATPPARPNFWIAYLGPNPT